MIPAPNAVARFSVPSVFTNEGRNGKSPAAVGVGAGAGTDEPGLVDTDVVIPEPLGIEAPFARTPEAVLPFALLGGALAAVCVAAVEF